MKGTTESLSRRLQAKAREQAWYEADAYATASRWCGRPLDAAAHAVAFELFLSRWLRTLASTAPTEELRARMAREAEALNG